MSKHYENYDPEKWRSAATHKQYEPTHSRHFIPGERVYPDSLLTVIGPGWTDRYGKTTWRDVKVLCDPQYGGCGAEVIFPYATLFQYKSKYSCGCKQRKRWNEVDHTGLSVTGYGTKRQLTILYYDEERNEWAYVCACCAEIGYVPRGQGLTVSLKLKAEARKVCPNAAVFVPEDKLGLWRTSKVLAKTEIEMLFANAIGAKFPGCKFVTRAESWGNQIIGIEIPRILVPKSAVESTD